MEVKSFISHRVFVKIKWDNDIEVTCGRWSVLQMSGRNITEPRRTADLWRPSSIWDPFWGVIELGCCLKSSSLENPYLTRQWLREEVHLTCISAGEQSPWSYCSFFPLYPNLWHHFPCWLSLMDFSSWFHLIKRLGKSRVIICSKTRVGRIGFINS